MRAPTSKEVRMSKAIQELSSLLRNYFEQKDILEPGDWSERFVRLSPRQSNVAGLYSLRRTPFFRRLYEDVANRKIGMIVLMKSAQVGASQLFSNVLLWWVCNKTLPAACVFPSQGMSQQFAERNLHPAFETTEPVRAILPESADDIRRTEFTFANGSNVKIIGGGSANKLSSNPIALLELDEVDKYADFIAEANPIELAIDRTLTFRETGDAKILMASTPTLEHSSAISAHYKEGSQSKYHVPCPHCDYRQELVFEQVQFAHCKEGEEWNLNRVAREAYYECIGCKGRITDSHKSDMINAGIWIDQNPNAPDDIRSYHISALYSLSLSFGDIARMFLSAKGDRSRLQNFYNSILGLPFVPVRATVNEDNINELIKLSPPFQRGKLHRKPFALVMGCDTQQSELYWCVIALFEGGATSVVDYGICGSFEDLDQVSQTQYEFAQGEFMGIHKALIDAGGNRTAAVYDFTLKTGGRFIACFGRTEKHRLFTPVRSSQINYKGYSLPIVNVNDRHFSDMLLMSVFKFRSEVLYLPQDTDDIFKQQITAVSIIEKKNKAGFIETAYESKRANHWFDALKYAYAVRFALLPKLEEPAPEETEYDAEDSEPVSTGTYGNGW